jgi:hypothetical protein
MNCIFKNKFLLVFIFFSLIFIGCGYKQTNTQFRDIAYIKFHKSIDKNYRVMINEKYDIYLKSCSFNDTNSCHDDLENNLYEVSSGNNNIKVYDNEKLILDKNIFFGSSNTVEVNLK